MEPRRTLISRSQELPRTVLNEQQANGNDDDNDLRKHQSATLVWRLLHFIESREVPACFVKRGSNSVGEKIFIVSGLKKVWNGTQPAAEVVRIVGFRPPRYLCYMISGSCCDVIQFLMYVLFYNQLHDASVCWALSFGGSIVFRHTTHRYLVFGDYIGGYRRSLGRMYAGYSIIIALSTIFNFVVTIYTDTPHFLAWILTLLWTGIVNYMILKKLWSFDGGNEEDESKFKRSLTGNSSENQDLENYSINEYSISE